MNSLFVCPHCGGPLERGDSCWAHKAYSCFVIWKKLLSNSICAEI